MVAGLISPSYIERTWIFQGINFNFWIQNMDGIGFQCADVNVTRSNLCHHMERQHQWLAVFLLTSCFLLPKSSFSYIVNSVPLAKMVSGRSFGETAWMVASYQLPLAKPQIAKVWWLCLRPKANTPQHRFVLSSVISEHNLLTSKVLLA